MWENLYWNFTAIPDHQQAISPPKTFSHGIWTCDLTTWMANFFDNLKARPFVTRIALGWAVNHISMYLKLSILRTWICSSCKDWCNAFSDSLTEVRESLFNQSDKRGTRNSFLRKAESWARKWNLRNVSCDNIRRPVASDQNPLFWAHQNRPEPRFARQYLGEQSVIKKN